LPETGIRFRLPKFRLVINKDTPKNGRGVMPDIPVLPTREALIQNRDLKVEKVRALITAAKINPS
jgi:C-terminal processing protease CtpA/Prc